MASLGTTQVQSDANEYRKQAKALAEIEPLVQKYREYKAVVAEIASAEELIKGGDPEMRDLALEELNDLNVRKERLSDELKLLLVPKDPNDERNVMLEIRAGTGGEEAALFAGDLYRCYTRYAERQRWKIELMSLSEADQGGIKDVVVSIEGRGAYSRLKYESGVHRVQRVPATEASGRIHTSAATVAVLPEADEIDIQIQDKDIRIDTLLLERSRRPERQHDLFGGAHHPHPDRHRRVAAGREVAGQEPRQGDEGAALATLRSGVAEAERRHRQGAQGPGRHRRSLREDPDLQLSAEPRDRSPHQLHDAPAAERARRQPRRADRRLDDVLHGGETARGHGADPKGSQAPENMNIRERSTPPGPGWWRPASTTAKPAATPNLLARHVLGWDRADADCARTTTPPAGFIERYDALIERRARREPVAYIRGVQEFWSRDFVVTPAVLIPRPETELIIEEFLARLPVDAPTGAAARRRHRHRQRLPRRDRRRRAPYVEVVATDISADALDVARDNAGATASRDRIAFRECARTSTGSTGPFDFILSNPPYVTEREYQNLAPEVREYEPAPALVAGEDGFRDIRQIVDLVRPRTSRPAARC